VSATDVPAAHLDLLETPTAILGTIGPDGRPQLTAIWYLVDDDGTLRLSLNTDRQKVRNLRERPVATLFLIDTTTPTRYLEVRADVELADDPAYAFADRVGAKYGADLRSFDGDHQERVVVTLRPVRVTAVDILAGS